jgi:hypothetical protein
MARRGRSAFAAVATALALLPAGDALADTMDPVLGRFVADTGCRTSGPGGDGYYNPASGFRRCGTYDAYFAKLVAQYGFAIAPSAMHSARTTGYGGYELAIEADYTKIDSSAEYWKLGTQGPRDSSSNQFSVVNDDPDGILQTYSLKFRKGFAFGLEMAGVVGFLANTNIVTGGADVRLSLLEGFRTGLPAFLPDVAVGGSVRTITGTEEMQLTVAGFDAIVSKPIPLGGSVVLTPYGGYQWIQIFGDSGLIDLTPNTDALELCNYTGPDNRATPGATEPFDGQPTCPNGSSADFNNTVVFDAVRVVRHRLAFGMQMRFQYLKVGAHFVTDVVSPEDANGGDDDMARTLAADDGDARFNELGDDPTNPNDTAVSRQWTLAFDIGAAF